MLMSHSCDFFELFVVLQLLSNISGRPQVTPDLTLNQTKERALNNSKRVKFPGVVSFSEFSEQEIVFPDSAETNWFQAIPRIDSAPKCAKGATFCEHFDTYPKEHLKQILQRNMLYKDMWGKDEAPIELSNRVGGNEDRFICGYLERVIFPKVGKNKNNKWKYIINQEDDGFIQGVRIETCRNHGGACDVVELPVGYTSMCKQKYIYRRLLSVGDSGSPIPDSFQIPSACCCSYRRNIDFLARFGAPVTPAKIKR